MSIVFIFLILQMRRERLNNPKSCNWRVAELAVFPRPLGPRAPPLIEHSDLRAGQQKVPCKLTSWSIHIRKIIWP